MNNVVLMGRLTRDPEVRYTQGDNPVAIARYTLAVDRRVKAADGQQTADFINIISFGKTAESAEKMLHKGMKICIDGRIQSGSYTNKDGQKVYTTEVLAEHFEFCEKKEDNSARDAYYADQAKQYAGGAKPQSDGFMNIPEGIDEELPFA